MTMTVKDWYAQNANRLDSLGMIHIKNGVLQYDKHDIYGHPLKGAHPINQEDLNPTDIQDAYIMTMQVERQGSQVNTKISIWNG